MDEKRMLTLREVQLLELEILKKTVKWFAEKGISYILTGGTLLGAVRHNGFIPWDDDIDIFVPRRDYERLKEFARNGERPDERILVSIPGDEAYPYPFIKMRHTDYIVVDDKRDERVPLYTWIDVFPLDHFPDDEKEHRNCVNRLVMYNHVLSACTVSKAYLQTRGYFRNPAKFLKYLGARILFEILGGYQSIAKRIDEFAKRMDEKYKHSNHAGDGAWPNGMKDYFTLDSLFPTEKHLFEDAYFDIPVNYDGFLSHFYGDYMKLPPIEDRMDHCIQVTRSNSARQESER